MPRRSAQARLEAIEPAIRSRDEFLARLADLIDAPAIAGMMAEAIDMHLAANGIEAVRNDGRVMICVEEICASHCLRAARDAYRQATGSNR